MKKPTLPKQPSGSAQAADQTPVIPDAGQFPPMPDAGQIRPIPDADRLQAGNDPPIDQDFSGYPHAPGGEEALSDGSAGAFDATEEARDDEDSDEDNDDFAWEHRQ